MRLELLLIYFRPVHDQLLHYKYKNGSTGQRLHKGVGTVVTVGAVEHIKEIGLYFLITTYHTTHGRVCNVIQCNFSKGVGGVGSDCRL